MKSSGFIYPEIGEIITPSKGIVLCQHFNFPYLVDRIVKNPDTYNNWTFDGASCVFDPALSIFVGPGFTWEDITIFCALPHDLQYAYGELGNEEEKEEADHNFQARLIVYAGVKKNNAALFYRMVKEFGKEKFGTDFSWGFANKNKIVNKLGLWK